MATFQLTTNRNTGAKSPLWSISKRFLYLMVAFIAAAMTLAACVESDENEGNENGNGGFSGKRIKSTFITEADGKTQKGEHTYNKDGMLVREDWVYSWTSAKIYDVYTNNPDGTHAKWENFNEHGEQVLVYSYDANKKPIKAEGTIKNSNGTHPITYEMTWESGRKIRQVMKIGSGSSLVVVTFDISYDSNGRRTSTTETNSTIGERKYTRAFNSDGTVQKVTVDPYPGYPSTGFSQTFTWENGKTPVNYLDDYTTY